MSPSSCRQHPCRNTVLPTGFVVGTDSIGVARVSAVVLGSLVVTLFLAAQRSAQALTFNLTFDASAATAPAGFLPPFNDALDFYETTFTDPITINLQLGWGTINSQSLAPGAIGESFVNGQRFSNFAGVKAALTGDAKSAADLTFIANMPASDPTSGALFAMSDAEAKALGLLAADAPMLDGYVGFNSGSPFTFDPNNRAVAGENDFIGVAEHEVSEVMGRYGLGQNGRKTDRYSPIDFFRYTSPGTLDLAPAFGAYFSIDGGTAAINTFNGPNGGDLSDWSGATVDAYNTGPNLGSESPVSAGDVAEMDVIGYDVAQPPAPGDYNHNGAVDAADYTVWRDSLGSTTALAADGNSNGKIDAGDYDIWVAQFGQSLAAPAAASAAAEPSSGKLILCGTLLMAGVGRSLRRD